jgi:hypothetical protein
MKVVLYYEVVLYGGTAALLEVFPTLKCCCTWKCYSMVVRSTSPNAAGHGTHPVHGCAAVAALPCRREHSEPDSNPSMYISTP